ncbi:MAG: M28 family peptidase [Ignisphaera sp.]
MVRETIRIANTVSSFGEVVAGSDKELALLNILRGFVEDHSDSIYLDPVPVTSWHEDYCVIEIDGDTYRCAIQPPIQTNLDEEVAKSSIIAMNAEQAVKRSFTERSLQNKVVVVETPRDPDDIATIARALGEHEPSLIIFSDNLNTIRRIVVLSNLIAAYDRSSPVKTPVIVVPSYVAKKIIESDKARILAKSATRESYGYNFIAKSYGSGDREIYIVAHHDHWLSGASDNVLGVALATTLFKNMTSLNSVKRGLALALFTAEEGFPQRLSSFYWLVGSRHFVSKNFYRLFEEVEAVINIDVVYSNDVRVSTSSPILRSAIVNDGLNLDVVNDNIIFDSFSFSVVGIPSATINSFHKALESGIYHSDLDVVSNVSVDAIQKFAEITINVIRAVSRDRSLDLSIVENVLASEIGGDPPSLEVLESLYHFFTELKKCGAMQKRLYLKTFERLALKSYVGMYIRERLGVREFTRILMCKDGVYSVPLGTIENVNGCHINYRFNIDLLRYIIRGACKSQVDSYASK